MAVITPQAGPSAVIEAYITNALRSLSADTHKIKTIPVGLTLMYAPKVTGGGGFSWG